jgi:Kdo2-lipid IVA lauroyltransferase/acyltransferase
MTPHTRSTWKLIRYRLERWGCLLITRIIPHLPRWVCLRLAKSVGSVMWRIDKRSRAVALANLETVFGRTLSAEVKRTIGLASFQNFARTMLDLFWSMRLTHKNHAKWFQIEGVEHAEAVRAKYGSNLFVLVHHGNFEWMSIGMGFAGFPSIAVAQDFKNSALDEVFRKARQVGGHRVIGQAGSMLKMLRAILKKECGVGLLVDLGLKPNQSSTIIEVFGGIKMCVTVMHAVLHQRTRIPLTPLTSVPLPNGKFRLIIHPAIEFPEDATIEEITQGCWNYFEPMIRKNPELYLWSYKHFRYRPRPDVLEMGRDDTLPRYPYYSGPSNTFDELCLDTILKRQANEEAKSAASVAKKKRIAKQDLQSETKTSGR